MEYLVLSDLHIDKKDNPKKVEYLISVVKNYKNIVLNGDFYESILNTAEDIITGQYKTFIELLKTKNTYYIYGNHDPQKYSEKLAKYISKWQGRYLKLKVGEYKYHIEHGDRLHREFHTKNTFYRRLHLRFTNFLEEHLDFLVQIIGRDWNRIVKEHVVSDKLVHQDEILVYGHTHNKFIDLKNKLINGGFNNFGKSSFIVLTEKSPLLKSFKY